MSLCPLSWRHIQQINRERGTRFVQVSAYPGGGLVAVDVDGGCFEVSRRGRSITDVRPIDYDTTTSAYLRGLSGHGTSEWHDEVDRRVEELSALPSRRRPS